jgi:nucleotide-binding universal stress UspA family protein
MYETILLPTDGSSGTSTVVNHALAIAERFDATIHTISVIESSQSDEETASEAVKLIAESAERSNVPVVTTIRYGVPHEEILDYATDEEMDLVIMGTHGRTGLNRYLLGSVTDRVLRFGDIPVLAVELDDTEDVIETESEAITAAREAVIDADHEVGAVPERPYRTQGTWVVRVETVTGTVVNVHVNAHTGNTQIAHISSDDT